MICRGPYRTSPGIQCLQCMHQQHQWVHKSINRVLSIYLEPNLQNNVSPPAHLPVFLVQHNPAYCTSRPLFSPPSSHAGHLYRITCRRTRASPRPHSQILFRHRLAALLCRPGVAVTVGSMACCCPTLAARETHVTGSSSPENELNNWCLQSLQRLFGSRFLFFSVLLFILFFFSFPPTLPTHSHNLFGFFFLDVGLHRQTSVLQ